jgi:serine phosphatase RsbU (regulator of sigma subunit)
VNDDRKTKKEMIVELEELRRDNAELRQQREGEVGASAVTLQLAVERVRAEAMAMKASDDLLKVVVVMWQEINRLGIDTASTTIVLIDEDRDRDIHYHVMHNPTKWGLTWSSSEWGIIDDNTIAKKYPSPNYPCSICGREMRACWQSDKVHVTDLPFTRDDVLYGQEYGFDLDQTHAERSPDVIWENFEGRIIINVPFECGMIGYLQKGRNERQEAVVRDLAQAFSFGYLRFLYFQKVEEQTESLSLQNRELAVEQHLEKVRTQVAEMVKGEDLFLVSGAIGQALTDLGVSFFHLSLNVYEERTDKLHLYHGKVGQGGKEDTVHVTFDLRKVSEIPEGVVIYDQLREGGKYHRLQNREDLEGLYRDCLKHEVVTQEGYETIIDRKFALNDRWALNVPFSHGTLGVARHESEGSFSDDTIKLLERFTEVFARGYRRYLDLEAAEQQAEQARHERALERVRAEAMAMRRSDDLLKVVAVFHQELNNLGIDTPSTSIVLLDKGGRHIISYRALISPEKHGLPWSSSGWVTFDKETIAHVQGRGVFILDAGFVNGMMEAWAKGDVQVYKEKWDYAYWDRFCRRHIGMADAAPYINDLIERSGGKDIVNIPFEHGMISIMKKGCNRQDEDIVQELAKAFSLGYLRLLDFQKVDEAQKNLIDELEEELHTAQSLQMGLMPTESPQIEGLDIMGRCIPANHVGGDFFQYFQQDGKLSVCMADVTGHAMEAAVPVMMFSGVLNTEMWYNHSVELLFAKLNRTMHQSLDKRTYVCFTMIELDLAQRTLQFSNSGCPYPYHYHASTGAVTELQVDAYPLGVRAETVYTAIETGMEKGDYIVFCSDGIIEAANSDEETFGFEQAAETIREGCKESLSAEALIDRLIGAVQAFAGSVAQGDDMTCVVLRVEK